MNKETKQFVINPEDVEARRVFLCRNGSKVILRKADNISCAGREYIWRVDKIVSQPTGYEYPNTSWSYTKDGYWISEQSKNGSDIIAIEPLSLINGIGKKEISRRGTIKSVRRQRNGGLKVTLELLAVDDQRIKEVIIHFPEADLKAGKIAELVFKTQTEITQKGAPENVLS